MELRRQTSITTTIIVVRVLTPAEKIALRVMTDWEIDEVTDRKGARQKAMRLLRRFKNAGVAMTQGDSKAPAPFSLNELGSTYTEAKDRFVVSLIIGYDEPSVSTPQKAVGAALAFTTDDGSNDTQWHCFDRQTGALHIVEQSEADPDFDSRQ